jgi:NADPH:quinone reductase-like Zn-dependent oxidoreductase
MERLATFLESGEVTPAVGRRYDLDDVAGAIADLEAGRSRGKSVIIVNADATDVA